MDKTIKYDESLEEISNALIMVSMIISECSHTFESSMRVFNNRSFGYLGKAYDNTTLLKNALVAQMNKLAQFYLITGENVSRAYEDMKAQDVYISRNLTMY